MTNEGRGRRCLAFRGSELLAEGDLRDVARVAKEVADGDPQTMILFFDAETSRPVEIDLRGSAAAVQERLPGLADGADDVHESAGQIPQAPTPRGPGRPRLGVVAREVTLLPRHWEWLNSQSGGASVALRRLVEDARKVSSERDRRRGAQESAYRFMAALAGDYPGFEEATRALFANDAQYFEAQVADWPPDVRTHARRLASAAFDDADG